MKKLSPTFVSVIVIFSLFAMMTTQFYLVYYYYQTIRSGLVRESDSILHEAFKNDLDVRKSEYRAITSNNVIDLSQKITEKNTGYNFKGKNNYVSNNIDFADIDLNMHISKVVPLNLQKFDSITGRILKYREIESEYNVLLTKKINSEVINQSKTNISWSIFQITSKALIIDINQDTSLQLILVNPFSLLFKRTGIMLAGSIIFMLICLLAFGYLLKTISAQKQLVVFKNNFLSTIAHELKRPVSSLSFNLDCLTMPAFYEDKEKHDLMVNRSVNATAELYNTINMIVALAKSEEGLLKLKPTPVDLSRLFFDLKERFMSHPVKKLEIQTHIEPELSTIVADESLLLQCFANLIDNSIKYSGSEVLIVIKVHRSDTRIIISIKDNGFGIPEEKLALIFDKYSRVHETETKINGYGIGLNYVKTIVEKHDGEVQVQSKKGEGTEFIILLPVRNVTNQAKLKFRNY